MTRSQRYIRWLIKFGLLWGGSVTLFRGLQSPNDWAEAQWLINYGFGFLKRALPGTLLAPFIAGQPALVIEAAISALAFTLLAIFCVVIIKMSFDILEANEFSTYSIFVTAVFLTSPFIIMSGHLNGYFDNLIIMLSCLAILLTMKGRIWAAACVLTVGLLVHETILLIGFPVVLWAAWLYKRQQLRQSPHLSQPIKELARHLFPFALPLMLFGFLSVYQAVLLDAQATGQLLSTYLARFSFIQNGRHIDVAQSYVTSFGAYLESQGPHLWERVLNPGFIIRIFPGLFMLLVFTQNTLRARAISSVLILAAMTIPFLPLSLHIIAWDTSRIFTYPLIVVWLVIWAENKFLPVLRSTEVRPALFGVAALAVIVSTIVLRTPLMDGEVDRVANAAYGLLYIPFLLLLTGVLLLRHFRLPQAADQTE